MTAVSTLSYIKCNRKTLQQSLTITHFILCVRHRAITSCIVPSYDWQCTSVGTVIVSFIRIQELLKELPPVSEATYSRVLSVNNYTFNLSYCQKEVPILYHIIELTFSLSFHMPCIFKCGQLPKLLSSISSCYGKVLWLHSSKFNFWLEG